MKNLCDKVKNPNDGSQADIGKDLYSKFIITSIVLMIIGTGLGWLKTNLSLFPYREIIESVLVVILSIVFMISPKYESKCMRRLISIIMFAYVYAIFFMYSEISNIYLFVCLLPITSVLFFDKWVFYNSILLNTITQSIFYFLLFTNEGLSETFSFLSKDIVSNAVLFISSQIVLFFIFILSVKRLDKLEEYHKRLEKITDDKVEYLAYYDGITGLANRTCLYNKLKEELNKLEEPIHRPMAVMIIDLDNFKGVNDTFGHDVGDMLLKAVSQRMQENIRKNYDIAARIGGDEFAIILPRAESKENTEIVAKRIVSKLNEPLFVDNVDIIKELNVTASIGITLVHELKSYEEVIKEADLAMYRSKREGKNRFHFYE